MSIQFNDTDTKKGLVQLYEQETGRVGAIAGNTERLKDFAADVNIALDELFHIGGEASGTWRLDDANHTELPIIRFNLVSGQRVYNLLNDEQGNLILDFAKVMVADPSGIYRVLTPRDPATEMNVTPFIDGQDVQGTPTAYDKLANGIRFDLVPNYSVTGGIEMYIRREPFYFTHTDTDRKAGIPGNLHPWLYIHPAEAYARRKSLKNHPALEREKARLEGMIRFTFNRRTKDEKAGIRPMYQNNR